MILKTKMHEICHQLEESIVLHSTDSLEIVLLALNSLNICLLAVLLSILILPIILASDRCGWP
jgi:hypothetical protein